MVQRTGAHDTNTGDPGWMSAPHAPSNQAPLGVAKTTTKSKWKHFTAHKSIIQEQINILILLVEHKWGERSKTIQ